MVGALPVTGPGATSAALFVFVRFVAKPGCDRDVERALLTVVGASRDEPGCRRIHAFRSIPDDREFYIHSIWDDEAAFTRHAALPHTVAFIDEVSGLVEHPVEAVRTRLLG